MTEWCFHVGGQDIGPLDHVTAAQCAERHPDVMCWRKGLPEWLPASRVGELKPMGGVGRVKQTPPLAPKAWNRDDEIDFTIRGHEMQYVEVDTGCLAALTDTVTYEVERAGGVKTMMFGGEGMFLASLRAPGQVWLQSPPFSRLAGRMLANAPQTGNTRGEGSVLGSLGTVLGGDKGS